MLIINTSRAATIKLPIMERKRRDCNQFLEFMRLAAIVRITHEL